MRGMEKGLSLEPYDGISLTGSRGYGGRHSGTANLLPESFPTLRVAHAHSDIMEPWSRLLLTQTSRVFRPPIGSWIAFY